MIVLSFTLYIIANILLIVGAFIDMNPHQTICLLAVVIILMQIAYLTKPTD